MALCACAPWRQSTGMLQSFRVTAVYPRKMGSQPLLLRPAAGFYPRTRPQSNGGLSSTKQPCWPYAGLAPNAHDRGPQTVHSVVLWAWHARGSPQGIQQHSSDLAGSLWIMQFSIEEWLLVPALCVAGTAWAAAKISSWAERLSTALWPNLTSTLGPSYVPTELWPIFKSALGPALRATKCWPIFTDMIMD